MSQQTLVGYLALAIEALKGADQGYYVTTIENLERALERAKKDLEATK